MSSKRIPEGAVNCLCISIGHRLGLYKALAAIGSGTSADLAQAAGALSERFVREWCYQQAAGQFISCNKEASVFWLSSAQSAVMCEPGPYEAPRETPLDLVLLTPNLLGKVDMMANCFRTGKGLTFDQLERAMLWEERFKTLPGLHEALLQGVKVADVGCGCGEVLLHLAARFPNSFFVGYDLSELGLQQARKHQAELALDNLKFLNPNDGPESRLPGTPTFHLVLVQEAIHDMTQPQEMLQLIRQSMLSDNSPDSSAAPAPATATTAGDQPSAEPEGKEKQHQQLDALTGYTGGPTLLVSDINSLGTASGNIAGLPGLASILYGMSVAVCLSSALSEEGGAGLGTVGFHEAVAREMSHKAGFTRFSMLTFPTTDTGRDFSSYLMMRP
eukprot:gene12665-12792_t